MAETTSYLHFNILSWNVGGALRQNAKEKEVVTDYLAKYCEKKKQASNQASVTIVCLQETKEHTKPLIAELNNIGISAHAGFDGTIASCRSSSSSGRLGGVALIWKTTDSEALKIKMSRIQIPEAQYNFCRQFVRCQILDQDNQELKSILICGLQALPKHESRFYKEQKWMLNFLFQEYKFDHYILVGDFNKNETQINTTLKDLSPMLRIHRHNTQIYTTQKFVRSISDYIASDLKQESFTVDHLAQNVNEHFPLNSKISMKFDEITEQFSVIEGEDKEILPFFNDNPVKLEKQLVDLKEENNVVIQGLKKQLASQQNMLHQKQENIKQSSQFKEQLKVNFIDILAQIHKTKEEEMFSAREVIKRKDTELSLLKERLERSESRNKVLQLELRSKSEIINQLQEQCEIQSQRLCLYSERSMNYEQEMESLLFKRCQTPLLTEAVPLVISCKMNPWRNSFCRLAKLI